MKDKKGKKKSLFKIFEEWLTWQKASVILTGLTTILGILTYLTQCYNSEDNENKEITEVELCKQDIKNFQSKIKATIESESLPENCDDQSDLKMIKDLNLAISECIYLWESYETTPYMSEIAEEEFNVSDMVTQWYRDQYKYITKQRAIIQMIYEIVQYGIKNNVPYQMNSKIMSLPESGQKQIDYFDSTAESCLKEVKNLMNEYGEENPVINDDKLKAKFYKSRYKCIEKIDLLRGNPDYYKFDKLFYDMVSDVTSNIAIVIKTNEQ